MNIYKFRDEIDGNHAFIIAKTKVDAITTLEKNTSIPFKLIESKKPEELKRPIILMNTILPF